MANALSAGDYQNYDATALAELIRDGEISAQEACNCAFDLAREFEPRLNAFIEIFDAPLDYAANGPFAGVPFVIKDLVCHAQGVLNENGSRLCHGVRAAHDTALMQKFRAAGLATLGRVASPEFGYCATTEALVNGPTHNPWDLERSPGGSSGGSGAAVAAGIVPLAHANDGGGSIRIPAACNGLVGLKPTRGRTSLGPDVGEALNGLAIEFALSRTVRDSAALLDAVAGASLGDPYTLQAPARPYARAIESEPRALKIALMSDPWSGCAVDREMTEALERTAKLCESLGHHVESARPPLDNDQYMQATHTFWVTNTYHWIKQVAHGLNRKANRETLEATTLKCYEAGERMSAGDLLMAISVANHVTREFAQFFETYDVLLSPVAATVALPLGTIKPNDPSVSAREWTEQQFTFAPFTSQFNMTGQPAISLPLQRTTAGLPAGMQFASRHGAEDVLLQLAKQLESAAPWPLIAPQFAR